MKASELLPPPEPPRRPFPWAPVLAVALPLAALAAAVGLQRLVEGPLPARDELFRWLIYASVAGLVFGAVAGFARKKRAPWIAWGLASPALMVVATVAIATAVRPLRSGFAELAARRCLAQGRKVCSLQQFQAACGAGPTVAQSSLGAPELKHCDASGCTYRWTYAGPWQPDNYVEPGAVMCSIVADPQGKGVRSTVLPGAPRQ